jgi:hypothetical protein
MNRSFVNGTRGFYQKETRNDLAVRAGRNVEKARTFLEIERCICIRMIAVDMKMDKELNASIKKMTGLKAFLQSEFGGCFETGKDHRGLFVASDGS